MYRIKSLAAGDTPADVKDHLPQGDAQGNLHQTGVVDFAYQGKNRGALALLGAEGAVPIASADDDGGDMGPGFDIVDDGGFASQAALGRKRRPRSGLTDLAFNGGDERGFFAADKGPGAFANT